MNKYSSDIIISIIKINKKMQTNLKNYSLIHKNTFINIKIPMLVKKKQISSGIVKIISKIP